MRQLKNKNIGARVIIDEILVEITPQKKKWQYIKKVTGVTVDRGVYEQYYHISTGANTYVKKFLIENDCFKTYAIKMDNGVVDIEGNNIIVVRDCNLKFLDFIPKSTKIITKTEYNKAVKLIAEYQNQQELL